MIRDNRLMSKISLTMGRGAARTMRRFFALASFAAFTNTATPALEMKSTPEKSTSAANPTSRLASTLI